MGGKKYTLAAALDRVESFFDQIKLRYKWRFNRWDRLRIVTYRGYGTRRQMYLKGRVLDDDRIDPARAGSRWTNIRHTIQRIETDEVPGAHVQLLFQGRTQEAVTDRDGFFSFCIEPDPPLPADRTWHNASLALVKPAQQEVQATGRILVPRPDASFGVISDIDDTVIRTGATSMLRKVRVVLLNNAHSRTPFEGIAAFYQALQRGSDGRGHNPIFYISSSPWNFYDLFEAFMDAHHIPLGPLFLKDFGFSKERFFKPGHQEHKLEHINLLLDTYPDLPFVLIGDSGQQDPEIYREAVRTHPGRIRAVYIRDVAPPARDSQVHTIAEEVGSLGVPMVLAGKTTVAAEHAAAQGLIADEAVEQVRADERKEQEQPEPGLLKRILG